MAIDASLCAARSASHMQQPASSASSTNIKKQLRGVAEWTGSRTSPSWYFALFGSGACQCFAVSQVSKSHESMSKLMWPWIPLVHLDDEMVLVNLNAQSAAHHPQTASLSHTHLVGKCCCSWVVCFRCRRAFWACSASVKVPVVHRHSHIRSQEHVLVAHQGGWWLMPRGTIVQCADLRHEKCRPVILQHMMPFSVLWLVAVIQKISANDMIHTSSRQF